MKYITKDVIYKITLFIIWVEIKFKTLELDNFGLQTL